MTIANAIQKYRCEKGLTQLDLAVRIDRTTRSVRKYESGEVTPSIKTLEKIFNTPFDDILIKGLVDKGVI